MISKIECTLHPKVLKKKAWTMINEIDSVKGNVRD